MTLTWFTDICQERERAAQEEEQREVDIARGNPLLNPQDFNVKRRWDDDVVFKNQARGTEDKRGKEFVNVSACFFIIYYAMILILHAGSVAIGLPQEIHGELVLLQESMNLLI